MFVQNGQSRCFSKNVWISLRLFRFQVKMQSEIRQMKDRLKQDFAREVFEKKIFQTLFLLWQSDFFSGEHSWGGDWGAEKEVWGFQEIQELKKRQLWTFRRGQGEQVRASVRMVDEAASILWKLQDHCEMKKYHATSLKFGHVCTALSSHQYWRRQLSTEAQTFTSINIFSQKTYNLQLQHAAHCAQPFEQC